MEEKVYLDKEWIKKYKELKIELSLIQEEIREIENYSILFLDEISILDKEIKELEDEITRKNKLPKDLKEIKRLIIEGTCMSLLAGCTFSVFFTPELDELTKEKLMSIFQKFIIFTPIFETLIMFFGIRELVSIKKELKTKDDRNLALEEQINKNKVSKEEFLEKRKSDIEIINKLNLEKTTNLLKLFNIIKEKYSDEIATNIIKKDYLNDNDFMEFLELSNKNTEINIEKTLLKKLN